MGATISEKQKKDKRKTVRSLSDGYIQQIIPVFLILLTIIVRVKKNEYILVMNDEFGYWSNAASIIGLNWDDLIKYTPYYSMGYSFFLVPIMILIKNPILMYLVAIILNFIFIAGSYHIAYRICKNLGVESHTAIGIGFLSVFNVQNMLYTQIAWSECCLVFFYWLSILFYQNSCHSAGRKRGIYTLLFIADIAFMFIIHQRSIGIVISAIIILIIQNRRNITKLARKELMFFSAFIIISVVAVAVYIMQHLEAGTTDMNKLFATLPARITSAADKSLYSYMVSFVGKSSAYLLQTWFVAAVPLVVVFTKLKKGKNNFCLSFPEYYITLSGLIMMLLSTISTNSTSRLDLIVYTRYMDFTMGPVFMLGCLYIIEKKHHSLAIVSASCIYYLTAVKVLTLSFTENIKNGFNVICSPFFGAFHMFLFTLNDGKWNKKLIPLATLAIVLVVFCVLLFLKSKAISRRFKISVVMIVCSLSTIWGAYYAELRTQLTRAEIHDNIDPLYAQLKASDRIWYLATEKDSDEYLRHVKYIQYILPLNEIKVTDNYEDICRGAKVITDSNYYPIDGHRYEELERTDWLALFNVN